MRVLVTGATGFTGGRLARRLAADGHRVRALVRRGSDRSGLEGLPVEYVEGDLATARPLDDALDGIELVFHVAALFRGEDVPRERFFEVNVHGARRLAEAAAAAGVVRFVHVSTVGVHGHIADPPADEDYRFGPGDHYQESKLAGERAVREIEARGLPLTIVRPAGIYGPGDTRFLKLFRFVQSGRFRMIGDGRVRYHFTYVDDLVEGMWRAGTHPAAEGETLILAGPDAPTLRELVDEVARTLGVPSPNGKASLPVGPVLAAATLCEWICRPLGIEPPLYRRRVEFFVKNRWFDASRARELIGFQPETGLATGLRRVCDWYRAQGMLPA